jgi:PAS domain S-box-containing protein
MGKNIAEDSVFMNSLPPFFLGFMEHVPVAMAIKDAQGHYIYLNRFFMEQFGVTGWLGKRAEDIYPVETARNVAEIDRRALAGETVDSDCKLPDCSGALHLFRVSKFPMQSPAGDLCIGCVLSDVTGYKETEANLSSALDGRNSLLKEVYHRVKNNLAMVSSLLSLEAQSVLDPRALKAFEECQSRIQSMALVHEELYGSDDLERINFAPYLRKIAENIVSSSGAESRVDIDFDVESVLLDPKAATPLGLIANELLTNILKYAFPDDRFGRIAIGLRGGTESTVLTVADDGVGIPDALDPDSTTSLGLQLIRSLADQIGGKAEFFRGGGFACRVAIPART